MTFEKQRKVVVTDYNSNWPRDFERLKNYYLKHLPHIEAEVQHVGSTSVPNLAAKPIIDIDVIVENQQDLKKVIDALIAIGYIHLGDLGICGREAFRAGPGIQEEWPRHNLYAGIRGCDSLENHLRLRDYLRENPGKAREYGELKKQLAQKFPDDIDSYVEGKTKFITKILSLTGMTHKTLGKIALQNKKPD